LNLIIYIIIANKKIREAKTWIRKYLIEDSLEIKLLWSIIKGIKDIKLISNPIHMPIQDDEEIVINVPVIKVIRNKSLNKKFIIKKKRIKPLYVGYEPKSFISLSLYFSVRSTKDFDSLRGSLILLNIIYNEYEKSYNLLYQSNPFGQAIHL